MKKIISPLRGTANGTGSALPGPWRSRDKWNFSLQNDVLEISWVIPFWGAIRATNNTVVWRRFGAAPQAGSFGVRCPHSPGTAPCYPLQPHGRRAALARSPLRLAPAQGRIYPQPFPSPSSCPPGPPRCSGASPVAAAS